MKILFVVGRHAYGDPARGESYEHANMLPALRALGHDVVLLESFDRRAHADFAAFNRAFIGAVRELGPDIVLLVLQSYELWIETLDLVRGASTAALVNWGTDDSWKYRPFARYLAPHVDLWATTSPDAAAHAQRDGHRNFFLTQWAANDAALAEPLAARDCRYDVTFVGAAYGNRRRWIEALQRAGVAVECFGHGWPSGAVSTEMLREVVRASRISLNFADSGLHWRGLLPYRSAQIKARVFDVPGQGGFLLTEHTPGLADYYALGQELVEFASEGELIERVRYYLSHPDERDRIALAGYRRVRTEHTYTRRLARLLDAAIATKTAREPLTEVAPQTIDRSLDALAARHASGPLLRAMRSMLVLPFAAIWGARRGPRAARRLVYELSWRLAGKATYSAGGWPGRLFYRES